MSDIPLISQTYVMGMMGLFASSDPAPPLPPRPLLRVRMEPGAADPANRHNRSRIPGILLMPHGQNYRTLSIELIQNHVSAVAEPEHHCKPGQDVLVAWLRVSDECCALHAIC